MPPQEVIKFICQVAMDNIESNEVVDQLAKFASQMGPMQQPHLRPREVQRRIKSTCYIQWNEEWERGQTGWKLYVVKSRATKPPYGWLLRKEQVVSCRLRFGHFPPLTGHCLGNWWIRNHAHFVTSPLAQYATLF